MSHRRSSVSWETLAPVLGQSGPCRQYCAPLIPSGYAAVRLLISIAAELAANRKLCEVEGAIHKSRYVVMNKNGGWQIRNAHRHVTGAGARRTRASFEN